MADIRRGVAGVAPTQTALQPTTSPSILPALADVAQNALGQYQAYKEREKKLADDQRAADFQIGLIDASTGQGSELLNQARARGASLDEAEAQSSNPTVIRNRRIADLRSYIEQDPANRETYNKIFKATVGEIGKELEDIEEQNAKDYVNRVSEALKAQQQKSIKSLGVETAPASVQRAAVQKQQAAYGEVEHFLQTKQMRADFGVPMTEEEILRGARKTTAGASYKARELLVEAIDNIPNIDSNEGRIQAQNMIARMKNQFVSDISDRFEGALSLEQINETYFSSIDVFDQALREFSAGGKTLAEISKNRNTFLDEVGMTMAFPTPQSRINLIIAKTLGPMDANSLGALVMNGEHEVLENAFRGVLRSAGMAGNTPIVPPKPGQSQTTPAPVLDVTGMPIESQKHTFKVIHSFGKMAAEAKSNPSIPPEQVEQAEELGRKTLEATQNRILLDPESMSTEEVDAWQEVYQDPSVLTILPKNASDAVLNSVQNKIAAAAGDFASKFPTDGKGLLRGTGQVSGKDITENVAVFIAEDGSVNFQPAPGTEGLVGSTALLGTGFRQASGDKLLQKSYGKAFTRDIKAYTHAVLKNTDYQKGAEDYFYMMGSAGGPKFKFASEFEDISDKEVVGGRTTPAQIASDTPSYLVNTIKNAIPSALDAIDQSPTEKERVERAKGRITGQSIAKTIGGVDEASTLEEFLSWVNSLDASAVKDVEDFDKQVVDFVSKSLSKSDRTKQRSISASKFLTEKLNELKAPSASLTPEEAESIKNLSTSDPAAAIEKVTLPDELSKAENLLIDSQIEEIEKRQESALKEAKRLAKDDPVKAVRLLLDAGLITENDLPRVLQTTMVNE